MNSPGSSGIVTLRSRHSVADTLTKLRALLEAEGIAIFALVDHASEAAKVGLAMPDTKLLIFGSPKVGTPLMLAAPSVAIDLPLKILVAENAAGEVSISYNAPDYLAQRHGIAPELLPNIAAVAGLVEKAAE